MAARDCINNSPKEQLRDALNAEIDRKIESMGGTFSEDFKFSVAIRETTEDAARRLAEQKRQLGLRILAQKQMLSRLDMFDGNPARGVLTAWRPDSRGQRLEADWESQMKSLIAENASLHPSLARLRPRLFSATIGVQTKWNDDIRRAAMGLPVKNAEARKIAGELKESLDAAAQAYRAAGGKLGKLEGWFLPQSWNRMQVDRAGQQAWVDELMGTIPSGATDEGVSILDRSRMKDLETDRVLDEDELRGVISFAWESIATDGLNKWNDPGNRGSGFAGRRDASRVLHFTPEGWMYINNKYGQSDTINAFLDYRDQLLRDTAVMQIFGPNPEVTKNAVLNALDRRLGTREHSSASTINDFHERMLGQHVEIKNHTINAADKAARSATTAVLLSGAFIPSIADFGTQFLNAFVTKTGVLDRLADYTKFMRNSENAVEQALDDMIVVDTVLSADAFAGRYDASFLDKASGFFGRTSQGVLEKSLLIPHTNAGRLAALNSHRRAIGKDLGKQWNDLNANRRALYQSYGITADQWDNVITGTAPQSISYLGRNIDVVDFKALRERDPNAFRRIHRMVLGEGDKSVLSSDVRTEEFLDFGIRTQGGSLGAIAMNQLKMFKRFPVAAFIMLRETAMNPHIPLRTKMMGAGVFFTSAIGFGALALQARQVIQGKDMFAMTDADGNPDWRFWLQAMIYGGGLPFLADIVAPALFGNEDFLNTRPNDYGKSVWDLSPTAGVVSQIARPFGEAAELTFEGDAERAMETLSGDALKTMAQKTAGVFGGNIWYVRGALDRFIWDQWEQALDPTGFDERVERQERFASQFGQEFFWVPGDLTPSRGPQFGEPQERF